MSRRVLPRVFLVLRTSRLGILVRTYGPFAERATADAVALASVEKHRGHTVEVRPIHPASVS